MKNIQPNNTNIRFLKIACLPRSLAKQYNKLPLLQCFVRGFYFFNGKSLSQQIQAVDLLELVREPAKQYDECAIALHFQNKKIACIPAEQNEILSSLLDAEGSDIMHGNDFYQALVDNSKTDEVNSLVPYDIGRPEAMKAIANDSLLIVTTAKLSNDLKTDLLINAFEEGIVYLENVFDKKRKRGIAAPP